MRNVDELIVHLGDLNGHVERNIDGFDIVHEEYGEGNRYFEDRILVKFSLEKQMCDE